jgi:hypothetical protein
VGRCRGQQGGRVGGTGAWPPGWAGAWPGKKGRSMCWGAEGVGGWREAYQGRGGAGTDAKLMQLLYYYCGGIKYKGTGHKEARVPRGCAGHPIALLNVAAAALGGRPHAAWRRKGGCGTVGATSKAMNPKRRIRAEGRGAGTGRQVRRPQAAGNARGRQESARPPGVQAAAIETNSNIEPIRTIRPQMEASLVLGQHVLHNNGHYKR